MGSTKTTLGKQDNGTFILRSDRIEQLRASIVTMNKRAKRTGTGTLGFETIEERTIPVREGRVLMVSVVRIVGNVPRIADHEFLARIEHHAVGNIVTRAPHAADVQLPESLRTDGPTCDHCQKIRSRKDTFVLRAPDGQLKRIGRNCLADYLRTADIDEALRTWKLLASIEEALGGGADDEYGGGGCSWNGVDIQAFLATVARVVSSEGWVSAKEARESYGDKAATFGKAWSARMPKPEHPRAAADWMARQPIQADYEEAAAVLAWVQKLAADSDYVHNLRVALSLPAVEHRNAGLVASAVVSYRKDQAIAIERARRAAKPEGKHIGQIKQRQQLELTVMRVNHSEGEWGVTTIVGLEDDAGNELVWFASGEREYKPGQRVRGKGTVKAHTEYKGRKQTVLSRCDFEVCEPAA